MTIDDLQAHINISFRAHEMHRYSDDGLLRAIEQLIDIFRRTSTKPVPLPSPNKTEALLSTIVDLLGQMNRRQM